MSENGKRCISCVVTFISQQAAFPAGLCVKTLSDLSASVKLRYRCMSSLRRSSPSSGARASKQGSQGLGHRWDSDTTNMMSCWAMLLSMLRLHTLSSLKRKNIYKPQMLQVEVVAKAEILKIGSIFHSTALQFSVKKKKTRVPKQ